MQILIVKTAEHLLVYLQFQPIKQAWGPVGNSYLDGTHAPSVNRVIFPTKTAAKICIKIVRRLANLTSQEGQDNN